MIDAAPDAIRKVILDIEGMVDYMPQIAKPKIIARKDKALIAEFIQTYPLPLITLKAKFRWQYTLEANGDISMLLHRGDVDAGVARYEFQTLSSGKTLVTYSYWSDLKTAGFVFAMVLKSQSELEDTMGPIAAAMVLKQLEERMENKVGEGLNAPVGLSHTNAKVLPHYPMLTVDQSKPLVLDTVEQLLSQGRLVLIHPRQWVKGKDKMESVLFASIIKIVDYPHQAVRKYLPVAEYYPEYFSSWVKKVETSEHEGFVRNLIRLKVAFGPLSIKISYDSDISQFSENIWTYQDTANGTGDFHAVFGIWEFAGINNSGDFVNENSSRTLVVLSNTNQLKDERLLIRAAKKIPQIDLISAVHMAMSLMTKQKPWLQAQMAQLAQ